MNRKISSLLVLVGVLIVATQIAFSAPVDRIMTAQVQVQLQSLPEDKKDQFIDFDQMIEDYVNEYTWFEDEDIPPFDISIRINLEYQASNIEIEDRYKCTIVVTGPDIQYSDKRAIFPWQKGEHLDHSPTFHPLTGLIDFYILLTIGNEVDKMGYLEGTEFFERAQKIVEDGKFTRYNTGWDFREETIELIYSENYEKFREMKDYFFYAVYVLDQNNDKELAKKYMAHAINMLDEIYIDGGETDATKQFIDAHHQQVIDLFRYDTDKKPIEILKELDFDREDIYQKYLD